MEDQNILIACVPHSASTVISHCISLIGNHHHGEQEDDPHGWRRGEFSKMNEVSHRIIEKVQDDTITQTNLDDVADFLDSLSSPWVVKDVHLCLSLEWCAEEILNKLGSPPLLLVVERNIEDVIKSFKGRSQWIRRELGQVNGLWNHSVEELAEKLEDGIDEWSRLGGMSRRFNFDQLCEYKRNGDRESFVRMFDFVEPMTEEGIEQAWNIFDHERPIQGHKKKGQSGW